MPVITPTNGRIVWFTPHTDTSKWPSGMQQHDPEQPFAAIVCHVWGDRMVNLLVTDSNGAQFPFTSVDLVQDGDYTDGFKALGRYAEWMPYQKGQAAKTEALERQVAVDPFQGQKS